MLRLEFRDRCRNLSQIPVAFSGVRPLSEPLSEVVDDENRKLAVLIGRYERLYDEAVPPCAVTAPFDIEAIETEIRSSNAWSAT